MWGGKSSVLTSEDCSTIIMVDLNVVNGAVTAQSVTSLVTVWTKRQVIPYRCKIDSEAANPYLSSQISQSTTGLYGGELKNGDSLA